MKQNLWRLLVYLGVGVLATACIGEISPTPVPTVQDRSLITQQPCAPPCWQELVPGETTNNQARVLLTSSPLVQGNFEEEDSVEGDLASLTWWWAGESQDVRRRNFLQYKSNVLQEIELRPNTDITIEEVVKAYGPPARIFFQPQIPASVFSGMREGVQMLALFEQDNFLVKWFEEGKVTFPMHVCPSLSTPLKSITYSAPERTQSYLDLLSRPSQGIVSGSGDSYVHLKDGQVTLDCVEFK